MTNLPPNNPNNNQRNSPPKKPIPPKKTSKNLYSSHRSKLWKLFIAFWVGIIAFFGAVGAGIFGTLPTFVELENPKSALATEIYSADNVLLGKFYVFNRSNATYHELPAHLITALKATEDARFESHSGIDFQSILRVMFKTILLSDESSGGGSTITQQLAKNLFHDRSGNKLKRSLQKIKEWIIALKLEKSYTKEEIITMYLNTVPFSENAHGIKSASHVYFSSTPDSLNIQEAATLVGMLKGSTKYNPRINPENSFIRRNVVIDQMANYGAITQHQADSIKKMPLEIKYNQFDHDKGIATHFREYIRNYIKEWAKTNVKIDGSQYDIYRDGLKIYTTIDSRMQQYAEEAVVQHMKTLQNQFYSHWSGKSPWYDKPNVEKVPELKIKKGDPWYGTNELIYRAIKQCPRYNTQKNAGKTEADIEQSFKTPTKMTLFSWKKGEIDTILSPIDSIKYNKYFLHTGFMATDPVTGHIKAWVGDFNYKYFKYDNTRPSSKRQVGSTFKPLVYTVAIANGWSPCRQVPNLPVVFEEYDNWSPDNASHYLEGQMVSLKTGLAHSINRVTAYLMKQIGPESVVDLARRMGIESQMQALPSICLGTPDISVFEMVGAYSTYANKGFYTQPNFITRIEDKNGNIIQTFPTVKKEVINEQTAYAMIEMLRSVVKFGTARRMARYDVQGDIAGKTGTTNDNSDGWFIGMTPQLVAGAWVGGDEKHIRFRSTTLGSGANMALPIWAIFMKKVQNDTALHISKNRVFERPALMDIEMNCGKYTEPASPNSDAEGGDDSAPTNPADSSTQSTSPATKPQNPTNTQGEGYDYNKQFD